MLKSLSVDNGDEDKLFTSNLLMILEQANDHQDIFQELDFNMDYFSYHLLDYLVSEFKLKDIEVQIEAYKSDFQMFRTKTSLALFCQTQKGVSRNISQDFKEVVAEFSADTGDKCLERVEQFGQSYAKYYNLRKTSIALVSIRQNNSIYTCTWHVPQSVIEKLQKKIPRAYLGKYSVFKLTVAALCVYHFNSTPQDDYYHFVEDPSQEFLCPVTYDLLLQPHLTSCCGQHLSEEAVKRIKNEENKCPQCQAPEWTTILSKHFLRQVTKLRVFCRDPECDWQGTLSEQDRHMQFYHSNGKRSFNFINFTSSL